jgi:DNA-directed RNA polymerase specialized sigma24 family protein
LDAPPSPKRNRALTQKDFDGLLAWLDSDREQAGQKYEKIRSALIGRFRHLNCVEPEARANETLDRVAQTLPKVIADYKGDPEPYFYAVAYNIYREYLRLPQFGSLPEVGLPDYGAPSPAESVDDDEPQDEALDTCLSRCLNRLEQDDRHLILEYYTVERREKIRRRKELTEKLGVKPDYLRVLVRRVKVKLKKCILDCLSEKTQERDAAPAARAGRESCEL